MYHFAHQQYDTPICKNIASKFSKSEPPHERTQESQDVAQHKPYLKALYNAYTLLIMDLMKIQLTILMLQH